MCESEKGWLTPGGQPWQASTGTLLWATSQSVPTMVQGVSSMLPCNELFRYTS